MMKLKLTIFLLAFSSIGFAQSGRSVITLSGDSSQVYTKIKWYSEEVYYEKGVNIYRSEEGKTNWEKLNINPIIQGGQIAKDDLVSDRTSQLFADITSKKSGKELEGIAKLSVLVHSVLNEQFALYLGIQFNDTTVEFGKTYTYRIQELQANGKETLVSTTKPITVGYPVAGLPPEDIKATVGEKDVSFTWKIEENRFFAVNVYQGTSPGGHKEKLNARPVMVASSSNQAGEFSLPDYFFVDDSLTSGRDYYYQLRAIDYFGQESLPSEEIHITTIDKTPPPSPRIERVKGGNTKEIRWKQKKTDDLMGFHVFRSGLVDTVFLKVSDELIPPEKEQWTIVDTHPGNYWYYLEAIDFSGNVSSSEQVLVSIPDEVAPDAPTGLQATLEPGIIKLTWSENTEQDLLGYLVFRALDKGQEPSFYPMFVEPQEGTVYLQGFSTFNQERYLYQIVALDTSFNQSPFSEIVSIQLPDKLPPEAPFLKDVYVENNSIIIEWLPSIGDDVKEYYLFRSDDNEKFNLIASLTANVNHHVDNNINSGNNYSYFLTATDSAGNLSDSSSVLSAEVLIRGEHAIDIKGKYHKKLKETEVRWKAENTGDLKGFVVYRSENSGPLRPVTGLMNDVLFKDNQLKNGQEYRYEVRAYDVQGNIYRSKTFEIICK